ncbi:aldose epimerase [Belnapia sp. T6]|uniref:Aldose epimerase n=1 Tax=Belnapia mucosa TaxID=2804532 RepID=A0ABS1VBM1_9PROT|nr:aldose epimerase [Belnapia mucosa]MBL6459027.1 aldose epimerase [Belnapia mucosa]
MLDLAGGDWRARLLPEQGGAFAQLAWRDHDVLVPLPLGADPNASFAGAFVMAPWTNRLDAGLLPVAGTVYQLPVNRVADNTAIHGLARDRAWQVESAGPAACELVQVLDGAAEGLPWHYVARLQVALGADGMRCALALTNAGTLPFPFGLGWHPFFLRPPGTGLRFHATSLFARDARCLPVAVQPSAGVVGEEPAYEGLDTHFAGWDGMAEIIRPDLRLRLEAAGAWARNLQVFAPGGSNILCVEPVSHVPDAPNRPDFAGYGPLAMLAPGAVLEASLRLTAEA